MEQTSIELIEEFYELIKDEYNISLDQLKDIILGCWGYTRREFESGELDTVRLQFFGIFTVFPGSAKAALNKTEKYYKEDKITKVTYNKNKEMLIKYLDKLENEKIL